MSDNLENLLSCPACNGDGKETCDNPDHGFIMLIDGEIGRLGCPCCGHDPNHKIKNGGSCEVCEGKGIITKSEYFNIENHGKI